MLLKHMTLRAAAIFLLFSLRAAAGEAFPLGGGELGPAVGQRSPKAIGSNANGYLVAWTDNRDSYNAYTLYVARLDRTGKVLDPEGIFAAPANKWSTYVRIASDGTDYLVLSSVERNLTAVRVTRDGVASPHALGLLGSIDALEWNGRHYVALLDVSGGRVAILLDRDGRAASGALRFLHSAGHSPLAMACRKGGKCLVAGTGGDSPKMHGGVISESMFPSIGARVERILPPLIPGYRVAVAATDDGYVAVTPVGNRMTVWRFDGGGDLLDDYTVEVPEAHDVPQIVAAGVAVDVSFVSMSTYLETLARLTPRGAVIYELPRRTELVGSGPAGLVAVWPESRPCIYDTCTEIFFGFRGTPGWRGAGKLLSHSRAAERMPRLARGPASILGAWVETRNSDEVRVRMLDRDGRPRTAPVVVAGAPIVRELLAAFDGVNYLVVWEEKPENSLFSGASTVYGRFVSQDGQLIGDRFLIGRRDALGSLAWNGSAYMVTVGASVIHLGTSGAELARAIYPYPRRLASIRPTCCSSHTMRTRSNTSVLPEASGGPRSRPVRCCSFTTSALHCRMTCSGRKVVAGSASRSARYGLTAHRPSSRARAASFS